jgi:hypothetical protein
MLNEIILGLSIVSFILLIGVIILLVKLKKFENKRIINIFNLFLVALFFIFLISIMDTLYYLWITPYIGPFLESINFIVLNNITTLVFIPLVVICFLVAVFLTKEV